MKKLDRIIDIFNINVIAIESVPQSYSSEVYSLRLKNGERVILKIPYNRSKLERERKILSILKDKMPVPKILDFWQGDEEITGALLLSYIDGESITGNIDKELALQMGELLGRLHTNEVKYYDLIEGEKLDWWQGVDIRFKEWAEECKGILDKTTFNDSIRFYENVIKDAPAPDGPCIVHFDYRPGNILVRDNKIKGLIDFESSRGGSADIDFTKIKLDVWDIYEGTKEAFIKGYESIRALPNIEETLPFYQFYNSFGGVAWAIRRNQIGGEFYNKNIKELEEIIYNINIKLI